MEESPYDIYGLHEEDVEANSSIPPDLVRLDSDPQLPVKNLLNFHRLFRSGTTEKEPLVSELLMSELDPVKEFYRKLELDKMYQERLYECGMGPMPAHIAKERELHPEKNSKDNFFFYLALSLLIMIIFMLFIFGFEKDPNKRKVMVE